MMMSKENNLILGLRFIEFEKEGNQNHGLNGLKDFTDFKSFDQKICGIRVILSNQWESESRIKRIKRFH